MAAAVVWISEAGIMVGDLECNGLCSLSEVTVSWAQLYFLPSFTHKVRCHTGEFFKTFLTRGQIYCLGFQKKDIILVLHIPVRYCICKVEEIGFWLQYHC